MSDTAAFVIRAISSLFLLPSALSIFKFFQEIENIKNIFLAILRDIKSDIDSGEQPEAAVTAAMFQNIQNAQWSKSRS